MRNRHLRERSCRAHMMTAARGRPDDTGMSRPQRVRGGAFFARRMTAEDPLPQPAAAGGAMSSLEGPERWRRRGRRAEETSHGGCPGAGQRTRSASTPNPEKGRLGDRIAASQHQCQTGPHGACAECHAANRRASRVLVERTSTSTTCMCRESQPRGGSHIQTIKALQGCKKIRRLSPARRARCALRAARVSVTSGRCLTPLTDRRSVRRLGRLVP